MKINDFQLFLNFFVLFISDLVLLGAMLQTLLTGALRIIGYRAQEQILHIMTDEGNITLHMHRRCFLIPTQYACKI